MRQMPTPRPGQTGEEYILWLALAENATPEEIQHALHRNYGLALPLATIEGMIR